MLNEGSGEYSPSGTLRGFLGRGRKIDALVTLMSTKDPRLLRRGGGGVASCEGLGLWEEKSQGSSPVHAGARGGARGPGLCWQCPPPPPWGFRSPRELSRLLGMQRPSLTHTGSPSRVPVTPWPLSSLGPIPDVS